MATLKIRKVTSLPSTLEPSCMYLISTSDPAKMELAVSSSDASIVKYLSNTITVSFNINIHSLTMSGVNGFSLIANDNIYTTCGRQGYYNATTGLHFNNFEEVTGIDKLQPIPKIWTGNIIQKGNDHISYNFILTDTNELWTWGYNNKGQCGVGHNNKIRYPVLVANDVVEVYDHPSNSSYNPNNNRLIVKKLDGKIYGCGYNSKGQLGLGNTSNKNQLTEMTGLGTNNIQKLFNLGATYGCVIALTNDGRILAAGYNGYGQLGTGNTTNLTSFTDITNNWAGVTSGLLDIKVTGGFGYNGNSLSHLAMLITLPDGSKIVRVAGNNTYKQLGLGNATNVYNPTEPTGIPANVEDIACVGTLTMQSLTATGDLWCWGYNNDGQIGNGNTNNQGQPILIKNNINTLLSDGWTSYNYGYRTPIYILDQNANLLATGYNNGCNLGVGLDSSKIKTFTKVSLPDGEVIKEIGIYSTYSNRYITVVCTMKNNLYVWGDDRDYGIYNYSRRRKIRSPALINFANILRN